MVDHIDRKYLIRMNGSGRIVSRNRRFIKISSARVDPESFVYTDSNGSYNDHDVGASTVHQQSEPEPLGSEQEPPATSTLQNARTPRMVRNLRPFNRRGRKENE